MKYKLKYYSDMWLRLYVFSIYFFHKGMCKAYMINYDTFTLDCLN